MNIFVFVIFSLFIVSIHADFYVIQQSPTISIPFNTQLLTIQINQTVNKPTFQSFISIHNATNNLTISQIDVSSNTSNATYLNNTLTFYIPQYNINTTFYITFDIGVLFSDNSTNSTAQTDPQFWSLTVILGFPPLAVIASDITTSVPVTSQGTTYIETTGSSMVYSDTSAFTATSATITYTSASQTTQNLNTTTTSTVPVNKATGESPPTRSAQIGMGLGITFIGVIIIGEIVYFKYFYSGSGRSDSYFT